MLENLDGAPGSLDQYDQLLRRDSSLTTQEFFQKVLPQDSIHYLVLFTKKLDERGSPFKIHKPFSDLETMAAAMAEFDNDEQYIGVYHACAGYLKPFIELDELNKWGKPKRQFRVGDNWHQAKAFWVDIDCGEEKHAKGEGYLTKRDACTALYKFADTIEWPRPMVVDSGNGIHAYWPLESEIDCGTWVRTAVKLKATAAHLGLIADPTRTADFASILRPAGSFNRKHGGCKEVKVKAPGTLTSFEVLALSLQEFMDAHDVQLIHEPKKRFDPNLNSDLTAHLPQYPDLPVNADKVADGCAQVAAMRDTQGDVGYEHWRGVIGILKHCVDGWELSRDWSAKREETGHDQLDWDIRYETWSAGPTTCDFFAGCNSGGCEGCPMKGKIKTPLVLGQMVNGLNAAPSISKSILMENLPDWYKNKDCVAIRPMQTTDNLKAVMKLFGWSAPRFNEMTKKIELTKLGLIDGRHDQSNAALVLLGDDVIRAGMSREGLLEMVETIGGENSYHPCKDWVQEPAWDGNSRLELFRNTLVLVDPTKSPLRDHLVDAWMLQGIGALLEPHGIAAQGVLTIVAPQARNKTRWVASLCSVSGAVRTGMHIDPMNKDSVFAASGAWITEAGELDTTTRKSDVGALKAFFTRSEDVLRPPYAKRENEYKRRTVFVGTVNGTGFLHDATGNRRYWTIEVDRCDLLDPIQMQQVWAEYLHKYEQGERWFLDEATQDALKTANLDYTAVEPLHDLICTKFDWQSVKWSAVNPANWRDHQDVAWLTATAICEKVGYINVTRPHATRAGAIVRELQKVNWQGITASHKEISRNSNGAKLLAVPKAMGKGA